MDIERFPFYLFYGEEQWTVQQTPSNKQRRDSRTIREDDDETRRDDDKTRRRRQDERMAPRGRHTIAQRNIRCRQIEARRREHQQIAQLLRDLAGIAANSGRRYSLRLANQYLNRDQPGRYTIVLFGEEGWEESDLYDHQIRVNYFECMLEGQRCRYYYGKSPKRRRKEGGGDNIANTPSNKWTTTTRQEDDDETRRRRDAENGSIPSTSPPYWV